jgi:ABC-type polysaccharide/polyol phosphate transport system ATPase subunit
MINQLSQEYKVELEDVSKRHNIYNRPIDRLKEVLWRNRRCYHREYWALRDLSVKFENCTTAVLGPNGAGKSTLLQLIAGVVQPTFGTVKVNGRVTAILELGAGFQPEYTGRENVMLNGMMLGISQDEMNERMAAIADFAEIGDFFDQPIKTYSSGMTVRLAFSTAISVDPEVLLVDEALAVGDERFIKKCNQKTKQLQADGKTIIFVTHDVRMVERFCQRAVLINGGQLVAEGEVKDVLPLYNEVMNNNDLYAQKTFSQPVPLS